MSTAPEQLSRDGERLAKLEARWSPQILDLSHDDAMRWYRTGKEVYELRRRIEAAERGESGRIEIEGVSRSEPS